MVARVKDCLARLFPRQESDRALGAFFEQLLADYVRLADSGQLTDTVTNAVEQARARWKGNRLTWSEAFAVERMLFGLLPDGEVVARAWHIRDRYRLVARDRYDTYDKSRTRDATGAALRAELDALLLALTEYYILREGSDCERTEFSHSVQVLTFVLLAVLALISPGGEPYWKFGASLLVLGIGTAVLLVGFWTENRNSKNAGVAIAVLGLAGTVVTAAQGKTLMTTLVVNLIAGLFGGAFSMLQRVQTPTTGGDPLTNLLSLRAAKREIFLAPITGALGALVLFCIFAAGLIKGDLFPTIVGPSASKSPTESMAVLAFLDSGPAGMADHAKSLVWSFIAGFSERFVPDALSRLTKKTAKAH